MNHQPTQIQDVLEKLKPLDIEGLILTVAINLKGLPAAASFSLTLFGLVEKGEINEEKLHEFERLNVLSVLSQTAEAIKEFGADGLIEKLIYHLAEKHNFDTETFTNALDFFPISQELSADIWGYINRYVSSDLMFEEPPDDPDYDFNLP